MAHPQDLERALGRFEAQLAQLLEDVKELKGKQRELEVWQIEHDKEEILTEVTDERRLIPLHAENHKQEQPHKKWKGRFEVLQKAAIALAAGIAAIASLYTMFSTMNRNQAAADPKAIVQAVIAAQKEASKVKESAEEAAEEIDKNSKSGKIQTPERKERE